MYIFLRESKILLEYGGRFINLDTTSEITCSQTFKETSIDRRTLHSRKNFFKAKWIRSTNTVSASLSLYITDNFLELLFFELAGWTNYDQGLSYPDYESNIPEIFNLYFIAPEAQYKLSNCVITSIDLSFNKMFCGNLNIGIDATSLDSVDANPTHFTQGKHLQVTALNTAIGNVSINPISAGISFTRTLEYLNSETVHNSHLNVQNNRCIVTDSNISATISAYLVTPPIADIDTIKIEQSNLTFSINNALITRRDSLSDIYLCAFDISPTETTNTITLSY